MKLEGDEYLSAANRFLRCADVSGSEENHDLEGRRAWYEVKGCKLILDNPQPAGQSSTRRIGRYYLALDNHRAFKTEADQAGVDARYVFVLAVGKRRLWTVRHWRFVEFLLAQGHVTTKTQQDTGAEYCYIPVGLVWE